MHLGLRIDVDTYRGTRLGVPNLCALLARHGIKATFFFSVGPDNMGRHLWRLVRPAFLFKMLRTNAPGLYGWDILLRGTIFPGPIIGNKCAPVIRAAAEARHEIGLHAWDHHAWQSRVAALSRPEIRDVLQGGFELLSSILGRPPTCSAAPAWRCTEDVLLEKARFPFQYNSDCRGDSIFRPVVGGQTLDQPQIPTTLPTYDELIGRKGVTEKTYNEFLLDQLRPGKLNVLTIHAEAEGLVCRDLFERFLEQAVARDIRCVTLGELLKAAPSPLPTGRLIAGTVPGREGWLACQEGASVTA